jgi:hypothetical protein
MKAVLCHEAVGVIGLTRDELKLGGLRLAMSFQLNHRAQLLIRELVRLRLIRSLLLLIRRLLLLIGRLVMIRRLLLVQDLLRLIVGNMAWSRDGSLLNVSRLVIDGLSDYLKTKKKYLVRLIKLGSYIDEKLSCKDDDDGAR